ncbi:MAG: amidohydrolase family protein [Clostridia bacterium]|nr:amidohydrolase family protein [Clostridia bacterium]
MKKIYYNGVILDGSQDMEEIKGKAILTEDKNILRIAPLEDLSAGEKEGAELVDLKGKYIMPGLINLHVHIPGDGKASAKLSDTKKLVKIILSNPITRWYLHKMYRGYVKVDLFSGVTTIRSVGGVTDYDTKTRDAIEKGEVVGPRILASNMAISVPEGHMAGSLAYECTSEEMARELVLQIAMDKPDLIKLMITGGVLDAEKVGEPGVLKMPANFVKAACEEAHKLGLMVAAHVESPEGVKVALENGVDTIEHGAKLDDELIALFKEKSAADVATIMPSLFYSEVPREISKISEKDFINGCVVRDGIVDCAKKCLENGIPVGLGTDVGCTLVTHYNFWRELQCIVKYCGVSNKQALNMATLGNAKIARIDNITGSIEEGKSADMIVLDRSPIDDLTALDKIEMVIMEGRLYRQPKVKKNPQVEELITAILE